MTMISDEAASIASQCRHYAMCKIDFLGTGLCPAGKEHHFVSYYPQGRMDIYRALARGQLPVTERLVHIADTCDLCGFCDKQCYFVTELRPIKVMKALKSYVERHVQDNKDILKPQADPLLDQLRAIVGEQWATNDPAILTTYAHDPGPFTGIQMPRYVIMPGTRDEVSQIVKLCGKHSLPYIVRGSGSSVVGFVFKKDGLVIDVGRMKRISIDKDNWLASVEPGVAAFDLQKEAARHGLRANVAEPSALVCGNLVCTGIFSTFCHSYGTGADNYVNAELVGPDGEVFDLNQRTAPNLFSFGAEGMPSPGVITRADVKLHPVTGDEDGVLVPFTSFHDAVAFARDLAVRRIGLAVAVLGGEYMATFMAPTTALADVAKQALKDDLGMNYTVLVMGDRYAIETVRKMKDVVVDSDLLRIFVLGFPRMGDKEWRDLVNGLEGNRPPYEILLRSEMRPLLEAVLRPAPDRIAEAVDPDLRDFYRELYSRPEMTNLTWLSMFRIVSSRMGRRKHVIALIVYVRLDRIDLIEEINARLASIADSHGLTHDYGFLTPLDMGKRAVMEYDYYMDHTDPAQVERMQRAFVAADEMLEGYRRSTKGVRWILKNFGQGLARKENFLYI